MAAGRGEFSPSQVARLSSAVATAVSQAFSEMPGPSSSQSQGSAVAINRTTTKRAYHSVIFIHYYPGLLRADSHLFCAEPVPKFLRNKRAQKLTLYRPRMRVIACTRATAINPRGVGVSRGSAKTVPFSL